MTIKNVLVIGNRGVAHSIVSSLIASSPSDTHSGYHVSVLTYPSQSPYLPSSARAGTVQHKASDFTRTSLQHAFAGQDVVISTVSGGYEVQTAIVDALIAADVKRFMPHEFGHDTLNKQVQGRISAGAERAKIIEYIKTKKSLEWVAVALGCILDPMLLTGDLGFDLEWQSATINGSGNEFFAASSLERVGLVVKSIIQHWEAVKNQFVYVAGVLSSGNEIVASLEKLSKSKWSVGYSDVDDCIREGRSRIERGFPDAGMFLLERSVLYDESLHATDPFRHRSSNELLGLAPETVDEIVGKAYHEFIHRGKPSCGCG